MTQVTDQSNISVAPTLLFSSYAGVQGQPSDQLPDGGEGHAVHAGRPHRHVRAQDLHPGRHLGHQLLRPVGVRKKNNGRFLRKPED